MGELRRSSVAARSVVAASLKSRYVLYVSVRALVHNGRLIVDQPTDLPEGTILDLVVDDEGDQLDPQDRAALDAAISRSLDQSSEGRTAPAEQILEKLRARRSG